MQRVVSKCVLASIVSLAFAASMAFAKFPGSARSSEKAATVDFAQSAQVPNGPTLQAGTYKVALLGDSATTEVGFYQNGELIGKAAATLVDQGRKSNDTETHINSAGGNRVVTEIDVAGWTKSIQFGQPAGASSSGQSGQ